MKVIEYNAITGEITEREMTAEEIAQMEAMQTIEIPAEQTSVEQQLADLQQKFDELKAQL